MSEQVKDYPTYLDYPKPRKKQTNADRIRVMTDEELSFFLSCIIHEWFAGTAEICGKWNVSIDNWLDWLKQEVEE